MFILALFAQIHIYLPSLFTESRILYLFSWAYNALTSKAWLAESSHDTLSSLLLIIGIASNCIIHTGNPPAIFSLILPHLPLRAEAGELEEWKGISCC